MSVAVCMTSTRGEKAEDCEFSGGSKVTMYKAKWKVDVVEASTGKVQLTLRTEGVVLQTATLEPFGIGELTARIRTALRHRISRDGGLTEIVVDGLAIDTLRRDVRRDGIEIKLTPKEYDLLVLLARHAGRVVTHKTLLTSVWGPAHGQDLHYLRVFIGQLRAKIERDPVTPQIVRTEPGVGYRLMTVE